MLGEGDFEAVVVVIEIVEKPLHEILVGGQLFQIQLKLAFGPPIMHLLQFLFHPVPVEDVLVFGGLVVLGEVPSEVLGDYFFVEVELGEDLAEGHDEEAVEDVGRVDGGYFVFGSVLGE